MKYIYIYIYVRIKNEKQNNIKIIQMIHVHKKIFSFNALHSV